MLKKPCVCGTLKHVICPPHADKQNEDRQEVPGQEKPEGLRYTSAALPQPQDKKKPARRWTPAWQRLALALLLRLTGHVQRLSRPRAMRLGERLGRWAHAIARRYRRKALRNLYLVHGETMTPREREDLVRRVFLHFGKLLVDFLRMPALDAAEQKALVSRCEGFEHVEAGLAAGRGVIILTAHFGNWEFLGRWLALQNVPLTVVARAPEDPTFSGYIRQMRESAGYKQLDKGASARELLARLRHGEAVGILPDQNSGDVFVPFFGVPVGTVAGPASLGLRTGAAVVPSYCLLEPDDTYRMVFLPPLDTHSTGDANADVARVMTEANRVLEEMIRRHPDQWLWLHNRWKSSFETQHRARWPEGFDYQTLHRRWQEG